MIRAFIAVELPESLREAITKIQDALKGALSGSGVRTDAKNSDMRLQWVRAESLHLTLKFLGDIEPEQVEVLRAALSEAIAGIAPFSVELEGIGGFPDTRAPRVVWAGVRPGGQPPLMRLASAVETALVLCGFPPEEKPFSPHLTLARVKGRSRALGNVLYSVQTHSSSGVLGTLPVRSIGLIKSELRPSGSIYTPLFRLPLRGPEETATP